MQQNSNKFETIGRMLQSCGCLIVLALIAVPLIIVLIMLIRAA